MPSNVNYYIFSIVPCLRTQISYRVPLPAVHLHVFVAYIIVFLFLVSFVRYRRAVAMISNFPGLRLITSPMCNLGLVLPSLPFPLYTYPGFSFPWTLKHAGLFKKFKCDTVSLCGWDGRAILYTCDVPFLTRMASNVGSSIFPKPIEDYSVLSYFGDNLVIAEHSNWRRQRRVTAPAFSSKLFSRMWVDMACIVHDMFREDRWSERTVQYTPADEGHFTPAGEYVPAEGEVYFPHVVDITLRMALAAIARTGFGIDFEWRSDESFTFTCTGFGDGFGSSILRTLLGILRSIIEFFSDQVLHARLQRLLGVHPPSRVDHATVNRTHEASFLRCLHRVTTHLIEGTPRTRSEMRLQEALHLVAKESTLKLALSSLPSWAAKILPFRRVHRMNLAFDCLQQQLCLLVAQRRREVVTLIEGSSLGCSSSRTSSISDGSGSSAYSHSSFGGDVDPVAEDFDLLSNLVRSAVQTERVGGKSLTDDEIIGNAYIYLLAGHETTAHSLAWTLALLGAYPDQQEKAYQEIMENDPSEQTNIRDYPKFKFLLACYHETLRLFPPVQQIPKVAAEDTQILIERTNEPEAINQPVQTQNANDTGDKTPRSLSASDTTTLLPSRIFSNHRRHKLPPLAVPAHLHPYAGSDLPFGTPSMPATPSASPMKEATSFNFSIPTPETAKIECFGPPPFVQLNKERSPAETEALSPNQDQISLVIEKGTILFISPPAVHYNPKYWQDPETFDPERFLKPYNRAAFIPFGVGTRACLGKKFSEVEAVCMLVHMLRNYSVHLPLRPGESVEDARRSFSKASVRITLTPEKVPLIFRRRTHKE